jgi:Glycosyl hydrolase family 26
VRIRKLAVRAGIAVAAAAVAAVAITHAVVALPLSQGIAATPPPISNVAFGAYVGPAKKGAQALPAWQDFAGTKAAYALDYAAADSWDNVTGPDWALSPWWGANRRLIYSVPLFPHRPADKAAGAGPELARCAAGDFDQHWAQLGHNLVSHRLATAIVRPGWEFDADWYVWAAHGRKKDYVDCFQHLVSAMRSADGQRFQFLWNPTVGLHQFPAEQAYPGDDYVDYVGVDVYDTSWAAGTYPYPAGATATERAAIQAKVWTSVLSGDRGLQFWATWASARGKRMAIPEWGLSERADGHGGGDDVTFVQGMLDFIRDPRNDVAFAMYFDADTDAGDHHRISTADTRFPQAAATFRRLMGEQS